MTNIWTKLGKLIINPALVAQRIEHLTTDQKVGGSSPSKRAQPSSFSRGLGFLFKNLGEAVAVNFNKDTHSRIVVIGGHQ